MSLQIRNLVMLAVGLLAMWISILCGGQPYSPDSASYIEQTRSLISGEGFESRAYGIEDLDISRTPDKLFPPGYPLVIAAGAAISGQSAEVVAPWVSRIALLFLPLTIFLSFQAVIGQRSASWLALLGAFSPGVIWMGQFAVTDVLSLTIVVASFGFTLAAWRRQSAHRAFFYAASGGVLAGFSYLTRNANLAFLIASLLSMCVWYTGSSTSEKSRGWRLSLSWALSASIVVFPWLIRNQIVFGKMQPYEMPPSTISAWINLRTFIAELVAEILGSSNLGLLMGWSVPGLIGLLILIVAVVRLTTQRWEVLQSVEKRAIVFSSLYVLLGSAVVVAARTKYQWGEAISIRHTLQYATFLLLPLAILLRTFSGSKVTFVTVTVALVSTLVILRAVSVEEELGELRRETSRVQAITTVAKQVESLKLEGVSPCAQGHKVLVVSNFAYLYRIICDVDARHPAVGGMGGQSIAEVMTLIRSKIGKKAVILAFHPGGGVKSSDLPLKSQELESLAIQGWEVQNNSPLILVIAHGR